LLGHDYDMVHRDIVRAGAGAVLVFLVLWSAAARAQTAPEPQRRPVPLREALKLAAKQGPDVDIRRAEVAAAEGRLYSDAAI